VCGPFGLGRPSQCGSGSTASATTPQIAQSLNNLAIDLRALGERARARDQDELALAMRQRLYGEQTAHPDIVTSLDNLAIGLRALGDHAAPASSTSKQRRCRRVWRRKMRQREEELWRTNPKGGRRSPTALSSTHIRQPWPASGEQLWEVRPSNLVATLFEQDSRLAWSNQMALVMRRSAVQNAAPGIPTARAPTVRPLPRAPCQFPSRVAQRVRSVGICAQSL